MCRGNGVEGVVCRGCVYRVWCVEGVVCRGEWCVEGVVCRASGV